jgi:cytoskeletal protein CcmA (bactofilin family)
MNLLFFLRPGFYISKDTVIHGNISASTNGYIAGTVEGNIDLNAHLTVEKQGVVNGDVHAGDVLIKGKIKGNVQCNHKVYVSKNAEVDGNIYANEVVVDKEGLVKGRMAQLHEGDSPETIQKTQEEIIKISAATLDRKPIDDEAPQTWF